MNGSTSNELILNAKLSLEMEPVPPHKRLLVNIFGMVIMAYTANLAYMANMADMYVIKCAKFINTPLYFDCLGRQD